MYRADLAPTTTLGEHRPVSSAPWQSSEMALTAVDPELSSRPWWMPSPASPAPSLPPADLSSWQPENPCPKHFRECDQSTELSYSTKTPSTQLSTSWSLASTVQCPPHSSQSLSGCLDAHLRCTRPREASVDNSCSSKLARDVTSRPFGCQLGTSVRRQRHHSSILASALTKSRFADSLESELQTEQDKFLWVKGEVDANAKEPSINFMTM